MHSTNYWSALLMVFLCIPAQCWGMDTTSSLEIQLVNACKDDDSKKIIKLLSNKNITSKILYKVLRNPNFELEKKVNAADCVLAYVCKNIKNISAEVLSESLELALNLKNRQAIIILLKQLGNGLVYGRDEATIYYQSFDGALEDCAKKGNSTIIKAILSHPFKVDGNLYLKLMALANTNNHKKTYRIILFHLCHNLKTIKKNTLLSNRGILNAWLEKASGLYSYIISKKNRTAITTYIQKNPQYLTKKMNNFIRAIALNHPTVVDYFISLDTAIEPSQYLQRTAHHDTPETAWMLYAHLLKNGNKNNLILIKNLLKKALSKKALSVGHTILNCDRIFHDLTDHHKQTPPEKRTENFIGVIPPLPYEIASTILTFVPAYRAIPKKKN